MIAYVENAKTNGDAVDIGHVAFNMAINLLSNMFFSVDLVGSGLGEDSRDLKELVWQMMVEADEPNLSDYFPVIRIMDVQGIRGRMVRHFEKIMGIFRVLIDQRLRSLDDHKDALDAFIKICRHKTEHFELPHISHLLLDLFVAGTDTMSSTVEWAMSELLSNPSKMKNTQQELEDAIGKGIPIKEEDMNKLPYLQSVIKETFRLHPPAPLLVPRKSPSDADVSLCGFTVPRNSQLIVNVWAMGRDPDLWENPDLFEPERFMNNNKEIDFKGRDFELIPFGAGRRICQGLPLATIVVPLMLGCLVNCFEWKLEGKSLDMEDKFGITLRKAQPLRVIPVNFDM